MRADYTASLLWRVFPACVSWCRGCICLLTFPFVLSFAIIIVIGRFGHCRLRICTSYFRGIIVHAHVHVHILSRIALREYVVRYVFPDSIAAFPMDVQ